jgi:selenocysteine lyase/cysteine desulfurase
MPDASWIAREFPQADGLIYLNHAAVSPWPARTAEAVQRFADENVRLGASRYPEWRRAEQALREQLARYINAPSADDVALLKNTSEALSVVACGLDWRWGDNVVSTDQEFPSNRMPWEAQRKWGVSLRRENLWVDDAEAALMAACDDRTRVLAVSSVQYASGIRLDLKRLGSFCRERGILFCVDAIQSLGALRLDVAELQVDFAMADAHKWLLGPEGIALFYCRGEVRRDLELRQFGWHMAHNAGDYDALEWRPAASARRFECGSPNMLGIHALTASLSLLEEAGQDAVADRILENSRYLLDNLGAMAGVELVTPAAAGRYAGIVSFRPVQEDSVEVHRKLQAADILCACRGGNVRLSPHFYITRDKLDKALEVICSSI